MLSTTGSLLLVPILSVSSAQAAVLNPRYLGADVPLEVERHREGMHQLAGPQGYGAVQISPPTAAMNGGIGTTFISRLTTPALPAKWVI